MHPTPPKNLTYLVIGLWIQIGLLVAASWFDLLVASVVLRLRGTGHDGPEFATALVTALVCTGLAVGYGLLFRPLLRGSRQAFKRTGTLLAGEIVALVAIAIAGSASHSASTILGSSLCVGIVLILVCGRLYLMPDVGAYIAYHDEAD